MDLFSDYNSPYLFAISLVLFIGLAEVISLICGNFLSGAIDAHIDHGDFFSTGHVGQFFHYLNIGKIPALVVLCLIAGFVGLFGLFFQHLCVQYLQAPLSNWLLTPLCLLLSGFCTHYTGRLLAPWLPRDETSAITEDEYIGCMALITGPGASAQRPCEARLTDKFGQAHYLLVEPEEGKQLKRGDKVLIICRLSATRYLAEINPWPTVL